MCIYKVPAFSLKEENGFSGKMEFLHGAKIFKMLTMSYFI